MQKNVDYIEDIGNNDAISYQDSFFDNKYGSVFRYIMLSDILNENEKSLFSDYLAEQYTPKQIALKHNISENAFFIRMTRIKEKISKYIKENEIKL